MVEPYSASNPGADAERTTHLISLLYDELRSLAAARISQEPAGITLQATDLVHEAFVRLSRDSRSRWDNRGHFFAAAAEAMRRILIEHARRKRGPRRGGDRQRVELVPEIACSHVEMPEHDELDISEALDKLAGANARLAEFFKLVRYGGLTIKEAAAVLGVCERTGKNYWKMAKAWLRSELEGPCGS